MTEITLRLTIADPVSGMIYSLQDQKSVPVGPVVATDAPLSSTCRSSCPTITA